jgi:hypothetical protein
MKRWLASLSVAMGVGAVAWGLPLGLRFAAWGARDTGLSAKDYIQDGLVAMWDGIENAGWGVHDDNATEWVDLKGGYPLEISGASATYKFGVRSYKEFNGTNYWVEGSFQSQCLKLEVNIVAGKIALSASIPIATFAQMGITETTMSNVTFESCVAFYKEPKEPFPGGDVYYKGAINTFAGQSTMSAGYWVTPPFLVANHPRMYFDLLDRDGEIFTACNVIDGLAAYGYFDGGLVVTKTDHKEMKLTDLTVMNNGWRSPCRQYFYCGRIYNRKLTDEEVKHNYEVDKARFGTAVDAAE